MANALYLLGKEAFLNGDIDWLNDTLKVVFTDHADDTPNVTTDDFLNDISAGTVATSNALTSPSTTDAVLDAADTTVSSVSGDQFESITIFKDTGNAATSNLLVYFDSATGLPCTPNGGDIQVTWDSGTNKIAKWS